MENLWKAVIVKSVYLTHFQMVYLGVRRTI